MDNIKKAILTFSKAQVSAWIATCFDYAATIVLTEIAGLWYVYATFIGALSGGIINCIINYKWVFKKHGTKKRSIALRYFVVWGISILLNTFGTYAVTEVTSVNYIIVKACVAAAVAIFWNYQMQRLFVFKTQNNQELINS
jgi:putative flippase GtrA